jgi:hypothetical protein
MAKTLGELFKTYKILWTRITKVCPDTIYNSSHPLVSEDVHAVDSQTSGLGGKGVGCTKNRTKQNKPPPPPKKSYDAFSHARQHDMFFSILPLQVEGRWFQNKNKIIDIVYLARVA